ncbi:MAG: ImmA/IrrE family metallo-endopeptidase [Bacteroidales bacterium]|nr:ImmA/IrrE family metallo-endopeptidase [Bacteroidales bacterium]
MKIDYQLQKRATGLRYDLNIGPKDPIQFKSLLLGQNILTIYKPLSETFSGMSFKTGDNKFMLINSNNPVGRQNFTICHELYHLFVQEDFITHTCNTGQFNRKNRTEYNADRFASYLLMPEEGLLELIPDSELRKRNSIGLPTILRIEQYYGCSRTALLYRLDSLDLIDTDKYKSFKSDIVKEARRYGFDTSLYLPGNHGLVIGNYGIIARKLFDEGKISESHYVTLMQDIGVDVDNESAENGKK